RLGGSRIHADLRSFRKACFDQRGRKTGYARHCDSFAEGTMKLFGIALLLLALQAAAQQPAPGMIQGIVVSGETGAPLSKAAIDVLPPTGTTPLYRTRSNLDGRFVIPNIRPGTYRVGEHKPGYVKTEYGQRIPGGPSLDLVVAPGQRIADICFFLILWGLVFGRCRGEGASVG